jgi:hypothetical protein
MAVTIGVDPHKGSHTAVVVDRAEQLPLSWLQAGVRNAVTEYRRGPWIIWPHRSIISLYAVGHRSLYPCSTMPCSGQGSPGDRQRKTSSCTTELGADPARADLGRDPVAPALWRRSAGSCRKPIESGAEERVTAFGDGRGVQRAAVLREPRDP